MEWRTEKRNRLGVGIILAAFVAFIAAYFAAVPRSTVLTATEKRCVGTWTYVSPDHSSKTCVIYHFASDRSVREEHYYLTSAWPTIPRMTMVGKWSVDKDDRLTVEPNQGVLYARDSMIGWLNEYFDNGRQAWERPVLTRFYNIESATSRGIQVECSRSGGGRVQFTMHPFTGDPRTVPTQ